MSAATLGVAHTTVGADALLPLRPAADGTLGQQSLAQVPHARSGMRCNDGRCDRQGRVLHLPMHKPTNCAIGGPDGRTLLVTSLSRGPQDLVQDPHGGRLLALRPGPQGLPEPRLAAEGARHPALCGT